MNQARCELTELLKNQCAHCRGDDDSFVPTEPIQLLSGQEAPFHLEFTVEAKFPGRCSACHGQIKVGTKIGRLVGETRYICEECVRFVLAE